MSAVTSETAPAVPQGREESAPRLADGTELLGEYEGSAYHAPQYLARRSDGQVIQLSLLLYLVASFLDGVRHVTDVAERVTEQFGRQVVADNVTYLIDNKLKPLGLLASATDRPAETLTRSSPLLALRYRARVVPPRLHRAVSVALRPLFWPPVVVVMLASLIAVNVWAVISLDHAFVQGSRQVLVHPGLFLLITGLILFSGVFHEIGHATAARYGGASPGVMGVGIYLIWPVFYTDLTDAYRLNRRGRLRSDLGGIYFNAIGIVVAGGVYLATGFRPLLVFMAFSQAEMLYQFLPFVRLDGYYVMSDLIGVPNLFAYIGPVLANMLRRHDPAVQARLRLVNRRAQVAIKVWAALTVVFLVGNFGLMAVLAPILIPAEATEANLQLHGMIHAFDKANVVGGLNSGIDLIFVAIAPIGVLFLVGLLLKRVFRSVVKWWPAHPVAAGLLGVVTLGAVLFQGQALVSRFIPHSHRATVVAAARPGTALKTVSPAPAMSPPPATPVAAAQAVSFTSVGGSKMAATPTGRGYWVTQADGSVTAFGDAGFYGSAAGIRLDQPVTAITATPDGHGYWLTAGDGGVFSFGDAGFYGSAAGGHLDQPVVDITATPDGHGYWLTAGDGGVFSFGDAGFYGSAAGIRLDQPVTAISATPDGHGYWLTAGDGGVFSFGDAGFYGSLAGIRLDQPVTAITPTLDAHGYWLAAGDGGVFTLGDAGFYGSAANTTHPVVTGIIVTGNLTPSQPADGAVTASDTTYHLIGANGTVISPETS